MLHNSLNSWEEALNALGVTHIELGLTRVDAVRKRLFETLTMPPVVLVAGTNGKGSTIALMQACLLQAGYRVGAYTSPHLIRLNERIAVNGKAIADDDFVSALNAVEAARGDIHLTYFEMTTLAAAYHFAVSGLDIALLEVGLGGRLDAVNIFDPVLSIVTNIGLDHMAWLGNTREEIGLEKAAVFRADLPAIYADERPVESVLNRATEIAAQLRLYNPVASLADADGLSGVPHSIRWAAWQGLLALPAALATSEADRRAGFAAAKLAGRFETICEKPLCIVDVAHNVDAASLLAKKLVTQPYVERWLAIFAAYADKDINSLLEPLQPIVSEWICCQLDGPRAANVNDLKMSLAALNANVVMAASPQRAWEMAVERAGHFQQESLGIIVFGSFETVGAITRYIQNYD